MVWAKWGRDRGSEHASERQLSRDFSQLPQMRAFSQATFLPARVPQVLVPVSDWWDKSNVMGFLRGAKKWNKFATAAAAPVMQAT